MSLERLSRSSVFMQRLWNWDASPIPPKHQEYYEIIRKESERLTSLINNILDFSRIEAGKKEYSFCETDVGDLVRSTLDSYRFEIEHNGFHFEQKIDRDLPPLRWIVKPSPVRLLNLVNNALKYSAREKYLGVYSTVRTAASTSRLSTTESASLQRSSPGSLKSSIASAIRWCITPKGSGLGLRWCATSYVPTVAKSPSKVRPGKAASSSSLSRYGFRDSARGGGVGMRQQERTNRHEEQRPARRFLS